MLGCRRIRGLIAASAYEELDAADRRAFERHVAVCTACRVEAADFARVVAKIPRTTLDPGIDLVPRLRARLAEERATYRPPVRRWNLVYAGGALAAVLVCALAIQAGWLPLKPQSQGTLTASSSVMARTVEEAKGLLAAHNYNGAYDLLSKGVAQHAADPAAASAQMMLADLAFERHWYDRADEAYKTLMTRYSDAVQTVPAAERARIMDRWNMLDEGRKTRYALLQELDRAGMMTDGAFEKYEGVVAQAPDSYVARQAVRNMVALAAGNTPAGSPQDVVTAMQNARTRCKHPIAVAKLDLEIGLTAWHDLKDLNLAQDALRKVGKSSEPVLAQRAREALAEIQTQHPS
jgi:hypothetical protein